MFGHYLVIFLLYLIVNIDSSQIDLEIPSISSSHTFELASNKSEYLQRDVLVGFVDDASLSRSSSILVRASYEQLQIERFFHLYGSDNKQQQQSSSEQIPREPIFRSYLLTPSFNRSYPFIRVLIASAQGSYEHLSIQPLCAIITAVNEQDLYESQRCFISPKLGYCLVTISVLKMIESTNQNVTTKKIELYLKLHHVGSFNQCQSNQNPEQNHLHHETRIGHAEYLSDDNIAFSTITRSSISIDYPNGIHYSNWYFPLKLKLILSSTSLHPSSIIRCRLKSPFSIYSIQTNIPKISNYFIQINHQIFRRLSSSDIDFSLTVNALNHTNANPLFEIDLATIVLFINSTKFNANSNLLIDWWILSNQSRQNNSDPPLLQIPIHVQFDDIQTIVALTDHTSLINTAMLSMQIQKYPLKILAVNHSGTIQSINQAVCHSENSYVVQVDLSCTYMYFSGHERDDFFDHVNSPASIVVRYGKFFQRIILTIYIPERPLRIELSDWKLSRISGWFITNQENDQIQKHESSTSRFDPDDDDDEENDDDEDEEDNVKCYPVYQQSSIKVFTKFYRTTPNGDRIYLFNKLNVLITPFVRSHLETDNTRVAIIRNGRVIGLRPGKTNVRIYSSVNKLPMGSKTITVDDQELIHLRNVSFDLLTNIDLEINLIEHLDPIYQIHFRVQPIFNRLNIDRKNQFGQIHVMLTYSDNTSVPLDEIPSDYYQFDLDTTRIDPALLYFNSSTSWNNLRIYPVSTGQSLIQARLKLGKQQCTDDRLFSQNDLSRQILISSANHQIEKNFQSSSYQDNDHYIVFNPNNTSNHQHHHLLPHNDESGKKLTPFHIALSILLGACVVLFLTFLVHWSISCYLRRKSKSHTRRHRNSTHSGAEEDNHDWIFLDRNSLEMPMKQEPPPPPPPPPPPSQQQQQQTLPVIVDPMPTIASNPSTLQRQKELSELSHSQMIAYFENLKESHA